MFSSALDMSLGSSDEPHPAAPRPANAVMEEAASFLGDIHGEEGAIAPDKVTKALNDRGPGFGSSTDEAGVKAKRGYEELVQQLESLQVGSLEPRSSLGQRFLSDLKNGQLKAEHDALKGVGSTQRKSEFRLSSRRTRRRWRRGRSSARHSRMST